MNSVRTQDRIPTTSLVIPVKDDAESLARCLRAVRSQSVQPDEIIVVDNDSTDDSSVVAARAGATVLWCSEPGIPAAAALGYDHATSDIILRLDADCVPGRTWVETLRTAFADRSDVAAFTGGARFIDGPRWLRSPVAAAYLLAYAAASAPALGHVPLFGSNMALRRDAWQEVRDSVHRHDDDVHDDLDLAFHLGESHRIRYLPGAKMGISMRPFRSPEGMAERFSRGFHTVAVHWPWDFPPLRWMRLAGRRLPAVRDAALVRGRRREPVDRAGRELSGSR